MEYPNRREAAPTQGGGRRNRWLSIFPRWQVTRRRRQLLRSGQHFRNLSMGSQGRKIDLAANDSEQVHWIGGILPQWQNRGHGKPGRVNPALANRHRESIPPIRTPTNRPNLAFMRSGVFP